MAKMRFWDKLFSRKYKDEKQELPDFPENESPDRQIERIVEYMGRISVPHSTSGGDSGFSAEKELNKLRGRLQDTVSWLRGGADAFGKHPTPSGVGYILYQVICAGTIDDARWVKLMEKLLGVESWQKLAALLNRIKIIGEQLRGNLGNTSS
jgi:hypothetical protein